MTTSPFRIVVTPRGSDGFHTTDHGHDARILTDIIQAAVRVQYGDGAQVRQIRHHEPPSRFHATPADVDQFLREHLAEDTLLRYQQAIGGRAVSEAAAEQRMQAAHRGVTGAPLSDHIQRGWRDAADHVDPLKGGGHWPAELISFACPRCDGTGGDHQIGCQS